MWKVVIGGLLAIMAGVVTQIITSYLNNKASNQMLLSGLYIELFELALKMRWNCISCVESPSTEELDETFAKAKLFASDNVANEFDKIMKLYVNHLNNPNDTKSLEAMDSSINVLSSIMRRELKTESIQSKKLYNLTIGRS